MNEKNLISPFKLFDYQETATAGLFRRSVSALRDSYEFGDTRDRSVKELLLHAPTGSGKTAIFLELIHRLGNGNFVTKQGSIIQTRPLAFVILAPNRLHLQARSRAFEAGFPDLGFNLLTLDDISSSGPLAPNSILFFNYSSTNKESNIAIRPNEQGTNLPSIMNRTRKAGIETVLVVDEAHLAARTTKSQTLINDIIQPTVIVNATATPELSVNMRIPGEPIVVNRQDVVDEGVIRKSIFFNADFDEFRSRNHEVSVNEQYIVASIKKHEDLKQQHLDSQTGINPMLMIQIPSRSKTGLFTDTEQKEDDEIDDKHLQDTLSVLKNYGYLISNGKVATYLAEARHKTVNDLSELAKEKSSIEVLVFKAAAAVGVDIPRAQVLAILRDAKSSALVIQTAGRVLRQPNQKHYDNDNLNHGYVYTAHESAIDILTAKSDEISYQPEQISLRKKYQQVASYWSLPNYKNKRTNQVDVNRVALNRLWNSHIQFLLAKSNTSLTQLEESKASLRKILEALGAQWQIEDDVAQYFTGEDKNIDAGGISDLTKVDRKLTSEEKSLQWQRLIHQIEVDAQAPRASGVIQAVLPDFVERINWRDENNLFQAFRDRLLGSPHNREWLAKQLLIILDQLKKEQNITDYPYTVQESGLWKIPDTQKYDLDPINGIVLHERDDYYMYGPDENTGYRPKKFDSDAEKLFSDEVVRSLIRMLEASEYTLIGYYKQPENDSSWGVPYEYDTGKQKRLHLHYPDWILVFERDKNGTRVQHLLFLETKNEVELKSSVLAKARALQQSVQEISKSLPPNKNINAVTINFPPRWGLGEKDLHRINVVEDSEQRSFTAWLEDNYLSK